MRERGKREIEKREIEKRETENAKSKTWVPLPIAERKEEGRKEEKKG